MFSIECVLSHNTSIKLRYAGVSRSVEEEEEEEEEDEFIRIQ